MDGILSPRQESREKCEHGSVSEGSDGMCVTLSSDGNFSRVMTVRWYERNASTGLTYGGMLKDGVNGVDGLDGTKWNL